MKNKKLKLPACFVGIGSFDPSTLLEKCNDILGKEIEIIEQEAQEGKLSPNSSRDLISYIKLLNESEEKQAQILSGLDEADLRKLLRKGQDATKRQKRLERITKKENDQKDKKQSLLP